jgi:hypothetical protein
MIAIQKDLADFIADFEQQIVELKALKAENPNGWVVKVGPLWIKFAGANYSQPGATGSANASVIRTMGEAYRVAKWVQNGGGDRGRVQSRIEALAENIAALEASVEFLKQQA